ncbi:hypothetical protein RHGRI_002176 [Rhododendron griersonianum]|uniref:Uncharacterized protein n=1 Tax=Rhododendron griersonianum TaxID=479676 RepID=A0AAV6LMW8_9ERIC|nr:hypothetical protein RHGRI_002176 [Rhododendron griersonianum]
MVNGPAAWISSSYSSSNPLKFNDEDKAIGTTYFLCSSPTSEGISFLPDTAILLEKLKARVPGETFEWEWEINHDAIRPENNEGFWFWMLFEDEK